jgi:ribonuclease P protein component
VLPKIHQLKKKEVERVFKRGQGFKEDFLFLKFIKNDLKISRFSVIVPSKVSKKATLRNKIKRRIAEILRIKIKKIKKGIDGIILAIPGLEAKDFWEIEESLSRLLERAKILETEKDV